MSTSAKAVRFDDDSIWVDRDDGRRMGVPLAWFPRHLAATPEQRNCSSSARAVFIGKRSTKTSPSTACWPVTGGARHLPAEGRDAPLEPLQGSRPSTRSETR